MNPASRIPILLSMLAAGLAPAILPAQLSCSPVNVLLDGGFEQAAGAPPVCPDWAGTSARFGSPVCSVAACGSADGIAPRTGRFWTLFGGTVGPAGETSTLTQQFTLPLATTIDLDFFLRIGAVTAPFTDLLEVRLDGSLLAAYPEPATSESAYAFYAIPLDAYADGGTHTLTFEFFGPAGGGFAAFNLDDVGLVERQVPTLASGSFEDAVGAPLDSPNWLEASTQFGSPLCTLALCGNGSGTVGPLTGDVWAWFGGVGGSTPETSSVSQTVWLPFAAYVDLEFQLGIGAVSAPFTDQLHVRMDGDTIASYLEPFTAETTYTPRSLIVDPFADGLPHTLQFQYVKAVDGNGANYSLDDIALTQLACQAILLDGFETRDTSNWSLSLP
ncbi:MAG: hypothetical protein ABI689_12835 [Thermoanaerobaculia bacterium]